MILLADLIIEMSCRWIHHLTPMYKHHSSVVATEF